MKKDLPVRKSVRLKGFDYSSPGYYFITICTYERQHLFGDIVDKTMHQNDYGKIAETELLRTKEKRNYIDIEKYVIMPNHIHLLVVIKDGADITNTDTARRVPTTERFGQPTIKSIPTIIRAYKSATCNEIRKYVGTRRAVSDELPQTDTIWQDRYHEHIIRDQDEYRRIWQYIDENPAKWTEDKYYI